MQCALDLCLLFYPQWTLLWTAFCVCVWCCNHSCSCTPKSLSRCLCLYCNWDLPSSAVHSLSQSGYWAGTISGELISAFHCKLCNTVECFDEIIVGFNFSFSLRFSYVLFCEAFSLILQHCILSGFDVRKVTISHWRQNFQATFGYLLVSWSVC